ncbi:MAG: DMT family transporter, partial [Nitrospirales bacterium]|nr:DMT family transporter [Nitrospirales bacterium]
MSSRTLRAYLELTLAMVIVGSSIVAGKIVIGSFPVFLASGLRFALASALLVPLLYLREKGFPRPARQDLCILFLQSFAGAFLFNVFLLYGLRFTSATESGIITATTPAVIGILSWFFLKERPAWDKCAGIVLSGLGILAVSMGSTLSSSGSGPNPLLGNTLVFGAVVGEALFTVLGKAELQKV